MRAAPFVVQGYNQHNTPMGTNFHLAPDTHALFFGPIECARHTFPDLVDDPYGSMLIVSDVQTSLGSTESLVRKAVSEICEDEPSTRAFILCTACQTAFTGIDLEGLCLDLHMQTGLNFGYIEANRMSAENIPGKARKNIPGGDRFHSRLATFRMLKQASVVSGRNNGVLVLTEDKLDENCDLLELAKLDGIEWVRGVGDFNSYEDFLACRKAAFVVATSMPWKETGDFFARELGIPCLYLPTSYSLTEIDSYYEKLIEIINETLPNVEREQISLLQNEQKRRRKEAEKSISSLLQMRTGKTLDLDIRLINRPFSLVETLMSYGFHIKAFTPSPMRVQHKEADDMPAFERLAQQYPAIGDRYKERPKSKDRKGGTSTRRGNAPGRFIEFKRPKNVARVPEETAWWGYSSVVKLFEETQKTRVDPPGVKRETPKSSGRKGKWNL